MSENVRELRIPSAVNYGSALHTQNIHNNLLFQPLTLRKEEQLIFHVCLDKAGFFSFGSAADQDQTKNCVMLTNQRFLVLTKCNVTSSIDLEAVLAVKHNKNSFLSKDEVVFRLKSGEIRRASFSPREVVAFFVLCMSEKRVLPAMMERANKQFNPTLSKSELGYAGCVCVCAVLTRRNTFFFNIYVGLWCVCVYCIKCKLQQQRTSQQDRQFTAKADPKRRGVRPKAKWARIAVYHPTTREQSLRHLPGSHR
jgi:hypothetical protein